MRLKRSPIWNIARPELAEIVQKAQTLGEVLNAFGLNNKGGNHKTLRARLEHDSIDFSHIPLGRGSNKHRHRGGSAATDLELVLVAGSSYNTNRLKKRLICPNCNSQTPTFCGRNVRQ